MQCIPKLAVCISLLFSFCFSQELVFKGFVYNTTCLRGALSVTVSPDGKHVYVAAGSDNAVSWFTRESATGLLTYGGYRRDGVSGVDGLAGAASVVVSPDGNHVYVAANEDDALSWFTRDPATGALTYGGCLKHRVGGVVLDGAVCVAISPDGQHLYVAADRDHIVSRFVRDPATGELTYAGFYGDGIGRTYRLGGARAIAVSPDGDHVYAGAYMDHTIPWFTRDVISGALTFEGFLKDDSAGVDGLYSPWSVALSPDGNQVYVAAYMDNAVSWFSRDHATGSIAYGGLLKDGVDGVDGLEYATSVAVCPTGKYVYATARIDEALTWYVRDPATGELTFGGAFFDDGGVVDVLGQASSVAVSPEGRHVYAVSADRAVSCFEMQDGNGIQLIDGSGVPGSFQLGQNSPNPFSATTAINFQLPASMRSGAEVSVVVYNTQGQIIRTLFNRKALPGNYSEKWNGYNGSGIRVPAGVYFCVLKAGEGLKRSRKIVVGK